MGFLRHFLRWFAVLFTSVLSPESSVLPATVATCLAISTVAGCGYQFQVAGPGPMIGASSAKAGPEAEAPRLAIPLFENKTAEPGLEGKITGYARREFSAGSGARVVSDGEKGDYVLKGQVLSVSATSLSFSLDATFEGRAFVALAAKVQHVPTGRVVWEERSTGNAEFFYSTDLQFNRVLQVRAIEQAGLLAAQDLATRFLDHVESGELARLTTATPKGAPGSAAAETVTPRSSSALPSAVPER